MGFLGEMERQKAIEAEARKAKLTPRQVAEEAAKEAEEVRLRMERPRYEFQYWERARLYFEQSGVGEMLNKLVSMEAAESIQTNENDGSKDYYNGILIHKWNEKCEEITGRSNKYEVKLKISSGYSGGERDRFVKINTDVDGSITFIGGDGRDDEFSEEKTVIKKKDWEKDKNILETELEKKYKRPILGYRHGQSINTWAPVDRDYSPEPEGDYTGGPG